MSSPATTLARPPGDVVAGEKVAIASVVNDRFLDGFVTLLYSIRRHNPWFQDVEVRAIYSKNWCPLSEHSKKIITAVHPNTTFHAADEAAFKTINFKVADEYFETFNENKDKREHYGKCIYLKMWSFTFTDLDRLIFIDADMLCLGDISHLWTVRTDFAACKKGRITEKNKKRYFNSVQSTIQNFNAGMYVATKPWLRETVFPKLVEIAEIGHQGADQDVLHEYWTGLDVLYMDSCYNVNHKNLVEFKDESLYKDFGQIRLLHLTGKKPWEKAKEEWNRCDQIWWEYFDLVDRYLAKYHNLHLEGEIDRSKLPALKCEFAELPLHAAFADAVRGKTVALVGPAETVVGTGQHDFIEDHDLVVRMNTVYNYYPFSEELAQDYGRRTDILYMTRYELTNTARRPVQLADTCQTEGIKFLVCANNSMFGSLHKSPGRFWKPRRVFAQHHLPTRLRFADLAPELVRTALAELVGYALCPRTGFAALVDLLLQGPASLYVTGFTFYHDGGNRFRDDCPYELHPDKSHDGKNRRNHNSRAELLILQGLAETYEGVLTFDRPLQEILERSQAEHE